MQAEIITIGDEILIGQTLDSNSNWIAAELNLLGISVYQISSVSDRREHILRVLEESGNRSSLVILTGGLGPTRDDITRNTLVEYFDTHLVFNPHLLKKIETLLASRGLDLNEINRSQAWVPEHCTLLPNRLGTAPGMWFEKGDTVYISLPGVPYEMQHIMEEEALPALRKKFPTPVIEHRTVLTYGTYEAKLAEMLSGFEDALPPEVRLAYLPSSGVIKLRLSMSGTDPGAVKDQLNRLQEELVSTVRPYVFGFRDDSLAKVAGRLLREKKQTLATAESCTGGMIAHLITLVPGSSDYYLGSVVAYANEIKAGILQVSGEQLQQHGAVSEPVVKAMAGGVKNLFRTDYAVAVSGIAGPDGGTPEKPVGTVWIAVVGPTGTVSEKHIFGRSREQNIYRASLTSLNMLRNLILSDDAGAAGK